MVIASCIVGSNVWPSLSNGVTPFACSTSLNRCWINLRPFATASGAVPTCRRARSKSIWAAIEFLVLRSDPDYRTPVRRTPRAPGRPGPVGGGGSQRGVGVRGRVRPGGSARVVRRMALGHGRPWPWGRRGSGRRPGCTAPTWRAGGLGFLPSHLVSALPVPLSRTFGAALLGLALVPAASPALGQLSDRVGRKPLLAAGTLALLVLTLPA